MDDDIDLALLRETARGFLSRPRSSADLAAMGWTGLLVPEALGGVGWRPVEAAVVSAELGRARNAAAWSGSALCAAAVARWGPAGARDRWLPGLLDGSAAGAVAVGAAPRAIGRPDVVVVCDGQELRVVAGDLAAAAPDPANLDTEREVLALDLAGAPGTVIGDAGAAATVASLSRLLVAADALGTAAGTRQRLVDYLRTRTAFGQPVGSFQAVQHRLVDLLVFELRGAAIVARAARDGAAHRPAFVRSAAAAHAFVTAAVVSAVDECMQLSGGIGFTWEYPLHHELRRVLADTALAGSDRLSRAVVADLGAW